MAVTDRDLPRTRKDENISKRRKSPIFVILMFIGVVLVVVIGAVFLASLSGEDSSSSDPALETEVQGIAVEAENPDVVFDPADTAPPTSVAEPPPTSVTEPPVITEPPPPTTEAPVFIDGVPGSCLILEERYCGTGVSAIWSHEAYDALSAGTIMVATPVVAFTVPADTRIFAPLDGRYIFSARETINPSSVRFQADEVGLSSNFIPTPESELNGNSYVQVTAGAEVGYVSSHPAISGQGELDVDGNFNLILSPFASLELNEFSRIAYKDGIPSQEEYLKIDEMWAKSQTWFWNLFNFDVPNPIILESSS